MTFTATVSDPSVVTRPSTPRTRPDVMSVGGTASAFVRRPPIQRHRHRRAHVTLFNLANEYEFYPTTAPHG